MQVRHFVILAVKNSQKRFPDSAERRKIAGMVPEAAPTAASWRLEACTSLLKLREACQTLFHRIVLYGKHGRPPEIRVLLRRDLVVVTESWRSSLNDHG